MVAWQHVKTPTAAATFLIDNLVNVWNRIDDMAGRIANGISFRLQNEGMRITRIAENIPLLFSTVKATRLAKIESLDSRMKQAVATFFADQTHRLDIIGQRLKPLNPRFMLERGYTLTKFNGHILKDVSTLCDGDKIVTETASGSIISVVKK